MSLIYAHSCRADGLCAGENIYRDPANDESTANTHAPDRSLSGGWDYSGSAHGTAHRAAGGWDYSCASSCCLQRSILTLLSGHIIISSFKNTSKCDEGKSSEKGKACKRAGRVEAGGRAFREHGSRAFGVSAFYQNRKPRTAGTVISAADMYVGDQVLFWQQAEKAGWYRVR